MKKIKKSEQLGLNGVYTVTIRDAKTGKVKRKYITCNIIPTVGRTMIADNLTNPSPDNDMRINYIALGTGATAPVNGDTTLVTESYRKEVSSNTNANNVAYTTGFFTATEVSGTFYEAALFSNATGSADSGVLFSRVLLNDPTGITKSSSETLTLDWTLTIS